VSTERYPLLLCTARDAIAARVNALAEGGPARVERVDRRALPERVLPGAVVLVDTPLAGETSAGTIAALRCDARCGDVPIVALVDDGDDATVRDVLGAGADDFLRAGLLERELFVRLAAQRRAWESREELRRRERDLRELVDLTRTFAGSLDEGALLHDVTRRLAAALALRRCSVVLTGGDAAQGQVIATSDDEAIARRTIELQKYPEIREALRTRRPVVVENADRHPLLDPVRDAVSAAGMGAMAVLPLALDEDVRGVLFLRASAAEPGRTFTPRELDLAAAVANATAVALERLRIESELASAREKLEAAARQAMIVELAGAAAHELNQPLTSVLGYAELLQRRVAPDDPAGRPVAIILREAERMAEVVRKIGSITRHETRAYVGETRIVDLDRAADQALPRPSDTPSARSSS